jgi:hypothetical protein
VTRVLRVLNLVSVGIITYNTTWNTHTHYKCYIKVIIHSVLIIEIKWKVTANELKLLVSLITKVTISCILFVVEITLKKLKFSAENKTWGQWTRVKEISKKFPKHHFFSSIFKFWIGDFNACKKVASIV